MADQTWRFGCSWAWVFNLSCCSSVVRVERESDAGCNDIRRNQRIRQFHHQVIDLTQGSIRHATFRSALDFGAAGWLDILEALEINHWQCDRCARTLPQTKRTLRTQLAGLVRSIAKSFKAVSSHRNSKDSFKARRMSSHFDLVVTPTTRAFVSAACQSGLPIGSVAKVRAMKSSSSRRAFARRFARGRPASAPGRRGSWCRRVSSGRRAGRRRRR